MGKKKGVDGPSPRKSRVDKNRVHHRQRDHRLTLLGPPHPGEVLIAWLADMGVEQAANRLQVTEAELKRLLNGKSDVDDRIAARLSEVVGGSAPMWLGLQARYNDRHLGLHTSQAALEARQEAPMADFVEAVRKLPPELWAVPLELFALRYGVRLFQAREQSRLVEALRALDRSIELRHRPSSILDLGAKDRIGLWLDALRARRARQIHRDISRKGGRTGFGERIEAERFKRLWPKMPGSTQRKKMEALLREEGLPVSSVAIDSGLKRVRRMKKTGELG